MKNILIAITLILTSFLLLSAEDNNQSVINYKDNFTVKITAERPTLNLKVAFADEELVFLPNTMVNGAVSVSYKNFSFSTGTDLDGSQKDPEEYGSTDYQDYTLSYYRSKFGGDIFYKAYKGFYIDNPNKYGSTPGDDTAKRDDLKMQYFGLNTFYIFAENYSLRSSFDFSERQVKSGGAFLLMSSISQLNIDSDYSLIPPAKETDFNTFAGYRGGQYTGFAVLPGAAYTQVINNFFLTGVVSFGGGFVYKKQKTNEGDQSSTVGYGKTNARISAGYNSNKYFGGIMAFGDLSGFSTQKEVDIKVDSIILKLYFGMRF